MSTYAITAVTFQRKSLFIRTVNAELLIDTLFEYRSQGRFSLHGFVVMPEHIHVVLTPEDRLTIERCVQYVKGGFSFALKKRFPGTVWQPGFYSHRVRDQEDLNKQLAYVAANPERRRLANYPFVHTNYLHQLDAPPSHLL